MEKIIELHATLIPIKNITISEKKIREAQVDSKDYAILKTAISAVGIILPILVRPAKDPETKKDLPNIFELADGCQRVTIARELGIKDIYAIITPLSDAELQGLQLMLNKARVAQRKSEEVKQIKQMMIEYPQYNTAELALLCGMEYNDIYQLTKLDKLIPEALAAIDDNSLKLVKALSLAKLPQDKQNEFFTAAKTETTEDFGGKVARELTNIRKKEQGLKEDTGPIAKIQKKNALEDRLQKRVHEFELLELQPNALDTPEYKTAALLKNEMEWVMSVDAETVGLMKKEKESKTATNALKRSEDENKKLREKLAASDKLLLETAGKADALGIN